MISFFDQFEYLEIWFRCKKNISAIWHYNFHLYVSFSLKWKWLTFLIMVVFNDFVKKPDFLQRSRIYGITQEPWLLNNLQLRKLNLPSCLFQRRYANIFNLALKPATSVLPASRMWKNAYSFGFNFYDVQALKMYWRIYLEP